MTQETLKLEPIGGNKDPNKAERASDDYDPHVYREVEAPTTNAETLIHLLKGCLGTGILAMPEAFLLSGMINGIISTFLIGILCAYCLHVLVKAQYIQCKKLKVALLTYPDSMKVACEMGPQCLRGFAPYAPGLTNFFLIFYQMGICCVYVVFVGKNLKYVGDVYTSSPWSLYLYMVLIFVPFVLILCIKNLKLLAPFSVLANVITLITFGVVCWYIFRGLPDFSDRPAVGAVADYPLYFGTTLFSLQAVGVVITLENNMATPKNFREPCGVLNVGMSLVTVIYVGMGMMGYWKYGDQIESSITMNFPIKELLAQIIIISYSIAIYISYGLQGYVPVQIVWTNYIVKRLDNTSEKMKTCYEYLLRIACVVITFVLAMTVPLLGLFISLVGSFCLSALGIAFPAIIELCANWPENSNPKTLLFWKDMLLIVIGVVGLSAGSYSAIYAIAQKLASGNY
ncbi:proton-coupled amino acid transporter-like protein CG1139 isoform X2 [Sitophilus oryzae]|uniref:Proton-coupled amino acid transporter-like protein CG1139 isoform X2 n=1 Tax=Sitophilus oryzae TaxID=7048 RepID=A0A6J2X4R9_SITOR|nr:proton-coupled amino acid transporter-like protein CG1139 isoform X2 [Sitophilus oryzae]XP_030746005.1 proton-coupled amino acid transporter-like protein CG1139 isoform X2 [Sitophilus oryzae]